MRQQYVTSADAEPCPMIEADFMAGFRAILDPRSPLIPAQRGCLCALLAARWEGDARIPLDDVCARSGLAWSATRPAVDRLRVLGLIAPLRSALLVDCGVALSVDWRKRLAELAR